MCRSHDWFIIKRHVIASLSIALAMILFVFAYAPLVVLAGNSRDFPMFDLGVYIRAIFCLAAAGFITITILLLIAVRWLPKLPISTLALATIAGAWLSTNIMVWDYGPLVGSPLNFAIHNREGFIDLFVWVGLFAAAVALHHKVRFLATFFAFVLITIQIAGMTAIVTLERPDLRFSRAGGARLAEFSRHGNVIIFILDTAQSDIAAEVFRKNDELRSRLDGFLFFPDTVGGGATTVVGARTILTGRFFDNSEELDAWVSRHARLGAPDFLPSKLAEAGFVLCQDGHLGEISLSAPKCTPPTRSSDKAYLLVDLGLFRALPHLFKQLVYNNESWFLSNLLQSNGQAVASYQNDFSTLSTLIERSQIDDGPPRFLWLHFYGVHAPLQLDDNCHVEHGVEVPKSEADWAADVERNRTEELRSSVTAQLTCYLSTLANLVTRLKEIGAYDNTTLIVAGDHGNPWGYHAEAFSMQRRLVQGQHIPDAVLTSGTPLLMVKPRGARGSLQTITAPASLCDIGETVMTQLELHSGVPDCFDLTSTLPPDRLRRFHFYRWDKETWSIDTNGFPDIEVFNVKGDSRSLGSWQATHRRFPNNRGIPSWHSLDFAEMGSVRYVGVTGWEKKDRDKYGTFMTLAGGEAHVYTAPKQTAEAKMIGLEMGSAHLEDAAVDVSIDDTPICTVTLRRGDERIRKECTFPALSPAFKRGIIALRPSAPGVRIYSLLLKR